MGDLNVMHVCKICKTAPNESFDLFDMNIGAYNCTEADCPVAESGLALTFDEWQTLMAAPGGEAVAYGFKSRTTGKWDGLRFVALCHADLYKPSELVPLYRAPAVDDGVLHSMLESMLKAMNMVSTPPVFMMAADKAGKEFIAAMKDQQDEN